MLRRFASVRICIVGSSNVLLRRYFSVRRASWIAVGAQCSCGRTC